MNVRPATTTDVAKFSLSNRLIRSRLVHDGRPENIPSRSRSSASWSSGSRASRRSVSRWIPRKVRDVVEASVFSSATGMPRYVQAARMISSRREQMSEAGGPAVKKSSRR